MIRLLAVLLPHRHREAILGDLYEEFPLSRGPAGRLRRGGALVGIVWRYQLAPYADRSDRRRMTLLLAVCVGMMWAVHATTSGAADPPAGYDPLSRLLLDFWAAPHLPSALSAGLLAGRFGGSAVHGAFAPWHLGLFLAGLLAIVAGSAGSGALAAGLCLAATALGRDARGGEAQAARH